MGEWFGRDLHQQRAMKTAHVIHDAVRYEQEWKKSIARFCRRLPLFSKRRGGNVPSNAGQTTNVFTRNRCDSEHAKLAE